MRFLQVGHPGTTTPLPPCATEGGSSTKQSKSCRRISFCNALSSSDFFTDGSLRFECRGNGENSLHLSLWPESRKPQCLRRAKSKSISLPTNPPMTSRTTAFTYPCLAVVESFDRSR